MRRDGEREGVFDGASSVSSFRAPESGSMSMREEFDELAPGQLEELTKSLIAFALGADRQLEFLGVGGNGDELALDWEAAYGSVCGNDMAMNRLSRAQREYLEALDRFLEARSGAQGGDDFWLDPASLSAHPDWQRIRELAHACLVTLGKDHLDLVVDHEIEEAYGPQGEKLIVQRTQSRLVPKRAGGTNCE